MAARVKVSSRYQVSVPSEARRKLSIKAGDHLLVEVAPATSSRCRNRKITAGIFRVCTERRGKGLILRSTQVGRERRGGIDLSFAPFFSVRYHRRALGTPRRTPTQEESR